MMPTVFYILMRRGHDPEEPIVWAVNDTKDDDTAAAIFEATVRALNGRSGLPNRWIENLQGRTPKSEDGRLFELFETVRGEW